METLGAIQSCHWIQEKYHLSDATGKFLAPTHGHLILSKFPFSSVRIMQLRSKQSNVAVVATFPLNSRLLGISSIQVFFFFFFFFF